MKNTLVKMSQSAVIALGMAGMVSLTALARPMASTPEMKMGLQKGVIAYQHNDINGAQSNLLQALQAAQNAKVENIDTAAIYNYLGITYASQGEYDKAHQYLDKGLELSERFEGKNSISAATSEGFSAQTYLEQGQFAPAEAAAQKALVIQNQQVFPDVHNKALVLKTLTTALAGQNKDQEAALYAKEYLVTLHRADGAGEINNTVQSMKQQAQTYATVTQQNADVARQNAVKH